MFKEKGRRVLVGLLDLVVNLVVMLALVFAIRTWIIAPFDVSGASMCDTLNIVNEECVSGYGEKLIINEAGYLFGDPKRGDIVVFKPTEDFDKYYIKRVIGLPNEVVEIANGKVYVTGVDGVKKELQEDYLNDENKDNTPIYYSDLFRFEVPDGKYFLLGDNRNHSTDSRSCFALSMSEGCAANPERAFIPKDALRGKAWFIYWPLSNFRFISSPGY
ncbi:signal peptidase I [Candidatus Peregrinibacteria bacterium HGW-Peregrinibacteria-1]|jgi:signal peptidase I|nr:MAG: signal peptidase I [Candidatus Peregrinibacteria bacterium HGW-Peregrinibacteria-1]